MWGNGVMVLVVETVCVFREGWLQLSSAASTLSKCGTWYDIMASYSQHLFMATEKVRRLSEELGVHAAICLHHELVAHVGCAKL